MTKKKKDDCPLPVPEKKKRDKESIDERRRKAAEIRRADTRAGQDIGEIPECVNPDKKAMCKKDFALFCKTYFPNMFNLAWSSDHLKVIKKIVRVIMDHDKFCVAMPRGSGKSSLSKSAALWALLYGFHQYVVLIGATSDLSTKMIEWFKFQLSNNKLLLEDFPEVCYPISLLENESRRCLGQRYKGKKTNIKWSKDRVTFPTIDGNVNSGYIIEATSLESAIRGLVCSLPNGEEARPTLAIPDDPQTRESARSQGPSGQTAYRLSIINQDVQGLAGPNAQTAILLPCTVIYPGDLADQALDRNLYPDFRGERTSRIRAWPTNKALWEQYREIRDNAMRNDLSFDESQEFYCSRMAKCNGRLDEDRPCDKCPHSESCMDCGCVIDWPERLDDSRNVTAIQAAMHSFYKYGPSGFAAEFQNKPLTDDGRIRRLTADAVQKKFSGRPRYEVPLDCSELVMGVDVHLTSAWYVVIGVKDDFTCYVVDYGVWPKQKRTTFTKRDVADGPFSFQTRFPSMGEDALIQAGLTAFIEEALALNFERSGDAGLMRISRILVDAGKWAGSIAAVKYKVGGSVMDLSKGIGITAGKRPMAEYRRKKGEKFDPFGHWYKPSTKGTREFSHVAIDVNYYKSEVHKGFITADGDPGSITLFGDSEEQHSMFAHHLVSETFVRTHGHGREVDEWTLKPSRPDNEWFDCMVYALCAASVQGIVAPGKDAPRRSGVRTRKRVPIATLMANRMKEGI